MTDQNDTPRSAPEKPDIVRITDTSDSDTTDSMGARKVAVALAYDQARGGSPRITASGAGAIADQILEIAFAEGVQVREDADLVEVLGALDVDSIIPTEVLAAVAEILSYVYRINREAMLTEMQS